MNTAIFSAPVPYPDSAMAVYECREVTAQAGMLVFFGDLSALVGMTVFPLRPGAEIRIARFFDFIAAERYFPFAHTPVTPIIPTFLCCLEIDARYILEGFSSAVWSPAARFIVFVIIDPVMAII